jgi:hypothetical protein
VDDLRADLMSWDVGDDMEVVWTGAAAVAGMVVLIMCSYWYNLKSQSASVHSAIIKKPKANRIISHAYAI